MELLALVIVNIILGIIIYFAVSIKVTNSVRDYQFVKLKKEIQAHTLNFYKESENYLSLMDSKITILKNLIQKVEGMGVQIEKIEEILNQRDGFQEKMNDFQLEIDRIQNNEFQSNKTESTDRKKSTLDMSTDDMETQNKIKPPSREKQSNPEPAVLAGIFGSVGKMMKGMIGIESNPESIETESKLIKNNLSKSTLDFSVGGDPLSELNQPVVLDNLAEKKQSFKNLLSSIESNGYLDSKPSDKIKISIEAALGELSENAGKVDKVVHLLKKNFTHEEISDKLGLAIPEISLIETIKMDKIKKYS